MYDIENYYNARTVEEAVELLQAHPQARVICGGSDVLIKIREGKFAGISLVSIREIESLQGVRMLENGDISIGAATTFSHITKDPIVQKYLNVLGEAVDLVGGPQVRNVGTIGGNICNGAVSADSAPTVFSYNARLHLQGPKGERVVPVEEFYLGPGRVDLRPGELLTAVVIPKEEYEGYQGHYIKYAMRNAMDIATLSCSVVSKVNPAEKVLEDVRITFGVAAPVPYRCRQTEEKAKGRPIGEELYRLVEEEVRKEINPRDSWRASKAFRLQIGGEIARRALKQSIKNAGGEGL
ncbi:MAG: xanthine dehydrogenase subunit XdhB [Blautia sp.]|jgi:xanthine dehydrogenase FAD-binding subunit